MAHDNKIWFITGCSTGFGRELATQLLDRGERVAVTARRLGSIVDIVEGHGERALALEVDVTDAAQIEAAVAKAEAHFGQIDVLVNNAGYGYFAAIEEGEEAEIRRQFEVNVFGLDAVTRRVLPAMRERRAGHIFNFSSIGGLTAHPTLGYYCATKWAVEAMSESLAKEVTPLGVSVTIVEPSGFRTDWAGRSATTPAHEIADYAETAGRLRSILQKDSGTQKGDPARAAQAIISVAHAAEPPLRLPLGSYAYSTLTARLDELRDQVETVKDITMSADFPDGA